MAEKVLDQSRIQTLVGQHVADAMAKHLWMNMKSNDGCLSRLGDDPGNHVRADRAATLADEHEWPLPRIEEARVLDDGGVTGTSAAQVSLP
jgi:hypothetical protein